MRAAVARSLAAVCILLLAAGACEALRSAGQEPQDGLPRALLQGNSKEVEPAPQAKANSEPKPKAANTQADRVVVTPVADKVKKVPEVVVDQPEPETETKIKPDTPVKEDKEDVIPATRGSECTGKGLIYVEETGKCCPAGLFKQGRCESGTPVECDATEELVGKECKPKCEDGEKRVGKICVPTTPNCKSDEVEYGNKQCCSKANYIGKKCVEPSICKSDEVEYGNKQCCPKASYNAAFKKCVEPSTCKSDEVEYGNKQCCPKAKYDAASKKCVEPEEPQCNKNCGFNGVCIKGVCCTKGDILVHGKCVKPAKCKDGQVSYHGKCYNPPKYDGCEKDEDYHCKPRTWYCGDRCHPKVVKCKRPGKAVIEFIVIEQEEKCYELSDDWYDWIDDDGYCVLTIVEEAKCPCCDCWKPEHGVERCPCLDKVELPFGIFVEAVTKAKAEAVAIAVAGKH